MFPEKFDPWMLLGVPMFWAYMAGLAARDLVSDFISRTKAPI